MVKTSVKVLLFVLLFLLLIAIGLVIWIQTLDANKFRSRLEQEVFNATGLELEIAGSISYNPIKSSVLILREVRVSDKNGLLFEFDSLKTSGSLNPFADSLQLDRLELYGFGYYFRTIGIQPHPTKTSSGNSSIKWKFIEMDTIQVVNGSFQLFGEGDSLLMQGQGIQSENGRLELDLNQALLEGLSITANGESARFKAFNSADRHLSTTFSMRNGVLTFESQFDHRKNNTFVFSLDLRPEQVVYRLEIETMNEEFHRLMHNALYKSDLNFLKGTYSGSLNVQFTIPDEFDYASLSGNLLLESKDFWLMGFKLDNLIKSFRNTQNFNLKDVGSVMLLGPAGLALSKGGDYASLLSQNSKDSSLVEFLYCDIAIDSGLLKFGDVAFRTQKNRIALSGAIDLKEMKYRNFTYSLLDKEGCSEISEVYNGSFTSAESERPGGMRLFVAPVTNLVKGTSSLVMGTNCDITYSGKVDHPLTKWQKKKEDGKGVFGLFKKKK